jgi:hypothetical protein
MKPAISAPLLLAAVAALACGGQVAGSETDGGSLGSKEGGGATASDSPSTLDSPADSPGVLLDGISPSPTCTQTGAGGNGGNGSCSIGVSESCSDGTTYAVKCSCPAATCECNESSGQGGSSGGNAPFSGCPENCGVPTVMTAYEACGFPLPQQ